MLFPIEFFRRVRFLQGGEMRASIHDKLVRTGKAIFFGLAGGTVIIHITPLARRIIRGFENRYIQEAHSEFETAVLLASGFLTMIMEPVIYIVNLALSLDKHGPIAFLWLAPVAISQSYACIRWIAGGKAKQTSQ
jgi:hypothetical protein